jgi:hypothetical protein
MFGLDSLSGTFTAVACRNSSVLQSNRHFCKYQQDLFLCLFLLLYLHLHLVRGICGLPKPQR